MKTQYIRRICVLRFAVYCLVAGSCFYMISIPKISSRTIRYLVNGDYSSGPFLNIEDHTASEFGRKKVLKHLLDFQIALRSETERKVLDLRLDAIIRLVEFDEEWIKKKEIQNVKKCDCNDINRDLTNGGKGKAIIHKESNIKNEMNVKKVVAESNKKIELSKKIKSEQLKTNEIWKKNKDSGVNKHGALRSETEKTNSTRKTKNVEALEVCPEIWHNRLGFPNYFEGWQVQNCTNVLPFRTVLSILLLPLAHNGISCSEFVNRILNDLKKSYRQVPLIIANINNFCTNVVTPSHVQVIPFSNSESNPGLVWNTLINNSTTRYVLIGRDLDSFMWMPNLERPVRVISYENNSVQIVGGAVRNQTGHWRIGCYQVSLRNYILEYQEGYHKSKNECMFCDSLAGPFVGRADLLKRFPFNETLPGEVLFEDFFLKLKQKSYSVVNCPDVMYFASDTAVEAKAKNRSLWLPLVKKWVLNRIVAPCGRVFAYSCAESGINCTLAESVKRPYYLLPICCLEQLSATVAFLDQFCRLKNLPYECKDGMLLGIVKVSGLMQWDLDGDVSYSHHNFSVFRQSEKEFAKHGFPLGNFVLNPNGQIFGFDPNGSFFRLFSPEIHIDMMGQNLLSYDDPRGALLRDVRTQALLHGHWVFTPPSPGLHARNQYGIEMLRHTQSWIYLNMEYGVPYKSGYFTKCVTPEHHACLDHFSPDGSLQFRIPCRSLTDTLPRLIPYRAL